MERDGQAALFAACAADAEAYRALGLQLAGFSHGVAPFGPEAESAGYT
jgi:hypothetical protein